MRILGNLLKHGSKSSDCLGQGLVHMQVSLSNMHMSNVLLNALQGEVSSTVEHEAKLHEMPYVTNKVIARHPGPSHAHNAR